MLKETNKRITTLEDPLEIAYLLKGLANLKEIIYAHELNRFEEEVRQNLLEHLNIRHDVVNRFDPYSISKVLRYLLTFNDSSDGALELYKSLSLLLTQTILNR
jgi:hypothetical protein